MQGFLLVDKPAGMCYTVRMILTGKISKSRLSAINFFADKLLSNQMARHIAIEFKFTKKLECLGLTTIEGYNSKNKPREFLIEINSNQSEDEIIKTISHELVHVKQYCTGELNDKMSVWRGQSVPDELEYHNQPWEIEAYFIGDMLYYDYIKEN